MSLFLLGELWLPGKKCGRRWLRRWEENYYRKMWFYSKQHCGSHIKYQQHFLPVTQFPKLVLMFVAHSEHNNPKGIPLSWLAHRSSISPGALRYIDYIAMILIKSRYHTKSSISTASSNGTVTAEINSRRIFVVSVCFFLTSSII